MKDFEFYLKKYGEIGFVEQIHYPIIFVTGLPSVRPTETVVFENGIIGQVISIAPSTVEVLTFSQPNITVGTRVVRTDNYLEIPVGKNLLGRVVGPLCQPIDSVEKFDEKNMEYRPIDIVPPGINKRKRISKPLETGVALVDLLIPIGKGQRELIIGDRKTGKTSFLRQTVLNQSKNGTICIYAAIGKKMVDIRGIHEYFVAQKGMDNTIIVASHSQDPAGIIFLTPYCAMAIAEYFRDQGIDVLVILDDLTTHAKFYREISLIAKRFPGRESYPGDIFYIHSRLLERGGNFVVGDGEASITCLPVAESLEGDIAGYIQTNIMSMVDGHIFFDNDLFTKGRRPAINPFVSVTRVGNQTQSQVRRDIHREIITVLNLFEKAETFVHFSSTLIESTKLSLATGEKILKFLTQEVSETVPSNAQTILFAMVWLHYWPDNETDKMKLDNEKIAALYQSDESVSSLLDTLVNSATSFNDLLGKIEIKRAELSKLLS